MQNIHASLNSQWVGRIYINSFSRNLSKSDLQEKEKFYHLTRKKSNVVVGKTEKAITKLNTMFGLGSSTQQ